jgi:hypothetical protein
MYVHDEQNPLVEARSRAIEHRHRNHETADADEERRSEFGKLLNVLSISGVDVRGVDVKDCRFKVCFDNGASSNE